VTDLCPCGVPQPEAPTTHTRIVLDGIERCADIGGDAPEFHDWTRLEGVR
jgi:hypothetical protein